ncbi:MAG: hypothetical protein RUDDFDWM_001921 [Candidatus Fervidibacterota bacterium]
MRKRVIACIMGVVIFHMGLIKISSTAVRLEASKPMNDAEFYGPFASWLDAKRDFGAKGDGISDDTEALQRALDAIRPQTPKSVVLFIPSGIYRITKTLNVIREAHSESQHITIVGENPEKTVIKWDGEKDGIMLHYGAWYSRMCRLTLDGSQKAKTAILCGPRFVTYNEFTDMIFRDVGFGIEAGRHGTMGIAETVVARCHFIRCSQAGISIQNWNSLDWFIWHCVFEDCRIGVTNAFGAGNYHVYESIFRNSTESDMSMGHAAYFSIRGNFSSGSRSFFRAGWLGACGFVTLQSNFVVDAKDVAVEVNNLGPVFMIDNIFKVKSSPVIRIRPDAALFSVGNVFTSKDAISCGKDSMVIGDKLAKYEEIKTPKMELPNFPPVEKLPVIEVPSGCSAEEIQRAIEKAKNLGAEKTIVHLPAGTYNIDRTLIIPEGCELRLVGDGGGDGKGTILRWVGKANGPVIRVSGPTHVRFSGFSINGSGKADGVKIERCDQEGARIIGDQLNIVSAQTGLLAEHLSRADVSLFNINHANCKLAIKVVDAKVSIFCGASSNNELSYEVDGDGKLLVRDIWYETAQHPRFMLLKGSGEFTMHSARVATPTKPLDVPVVDIDGFKGNVVFIGTNFVTEPGEERRTKVMVKGDGKDTNVLLLGCGGDGDSDLLFNASQMATCASLQAFKMVKGGGWVRAKDFGEVSKESLVEMLKLTRQTLPQLLIPLSRDSTDVRFHRVIVGNTNVGVWITR